MILVNLCLWFHIAWSPCRVVREGKEKRKKWAEKLTPKPAQKDVSIEDAMDIESEEESPDNKGMLPDEIVKLLAAREKYVSFLHFGCLSFIYASRNRIYWG